ncbi:ABC transporter substrate-binding protein [Caballeronia glebae]|uniref:ABC transporter substrate-binding protein n=1 Tax=Caballeronia glebae TaxID=1777143 RepID=UPI0038B9B5A1
MSDDVLRPGSMSRRKALVLAASAAALSTVPFIKKAKAADRRIVVRDPGGPIGAMYQKVFYEPFKKESGITVVGVTSDSEPSGLIKAMVQSKNYTWDAAILTSPQVEILSSINALEPVGPAGKNVSQIPDDFKSEFFVGSAVTASILGYRTDQLKTFPSGWKDFYEPERVPGRRSLRKHPFDTLESALLADGVPAAQLYPLDIDRALKKLEAVKRSNPVWWTSGAQITQAITSGEVDMVGGFENRIGYALDDGIPGAMVWDGGTWVCEGWAVLKGTPNAALAREFIEYVSDATRQAAWAPRMRLGPTNPGALANLPPDVAKRLPSHPDNLKKMVKVNAAYWRKEQAQALERFNAWLAS